MQRTEVSICNRALGMAGIGRIQSIDDTASEAARTCKSLYADLRDEIMTRHEWQFAKGRSVLAQLSQAPAFGFSYAYQLPTDCLRPLRLDIVSGVGKEPLWEAEGDQLFCDLETGVNLHYIKRVTNPTIFSSMFVSALCLRLASDLAMILKRDQGLQIKFMEILEQMLPRLEGTDAKSENQEMQGADPSLSVYVQAR